MARFHDLAPHRRNRPHDREPVHPTHCRPVDSATPAKLPCAQQTPKLRKRRKMAAIRVKSKANALVERGNSRLQSTQQRIRSSYRTNRQRSFPIGAAQSPRLPPCQGFPTRATVSTRRNLAPWPASKNLKPSRLTFGSALTALSAHSCRAQLLRLRHIMAIIAVHYL